jgi:hypothetical protein
MKLDSMMDVQHRIFKMQDKVWSKEEA